MKRERATLFIVIALAAALITSSASAARNTDETDPGAAAAFINRASLAARPGNGLNLYDNIHEYMWREVYIMARVDYVMPKDETGQYVFIRTWHGQSCKAYPLADSDFTISDPRITLDGFAIGGDVLLHVSPGVDLPNVDRPDVDIELVGVVCGVQRFVESLFLPVAAWPIICIPGDGVARIRPLPVYNSWLE